MKEAINAVPAELLNKSGSVFYSGRDAYSGTCPIYILGLNPGGNPERQAGETIEAHLDGLNSLPSNWSAYRDASWRGKPPGQHGMQPRVLHMFEALELDPGKVPASNLVFVRSSREATLEGSMSELAERCWPVHQATIESMRTRLILCFGRTVGEFVRKKLKTHQQTSEFVEQNARRWTTRSYSNKGGLRVVVATHPSIADWTKPSTDPSALVCSELGESTFQHSCLRTKLSQKSKA